TTGRAMPCAKTFRCAATSRTVLLKTFFRRSRRSFNVGRPVFVFFRQALKRKRLSVSRGTYRGGLRRRKMYPNQPQQGQFGGPVMNQPQQKGCWGRNWKWIVPTGCLGLILLGVAIVACVFFFVISAVKSSEVYQYALEKARSNPEVVAELGEPIKDGWLVQGSVETSVGGRGHAKFQIPISGPKKSGTIYAEALKDPQVVGGTWYFTDLSVAVAGRADRIDLREKTSTGREPEEENDNANDATGEARQEEEYVEKVEPLTPQPPTRTPPSSTIVSGGVLNGKAVS